jgi:hypothetical protein
MSSLPLKFLFLAVSLTASLAACSWVQPNPPHELTPEGKQVRVVERASDVAACRSLGKITGRAASVVGKADVVEDETIDARNKAAKAGGNAIIRRENPAPVAEPGTQAFEVYLCPQ